MTDVVKISVRPIIKLEINVDDSPINSFQNKTLRPILKYQNSLLANLGRIYIHKLANISLDKERRTFLQDFFNKNPQVNHLFIGTIIGMFTNDELDFYAENRNEVNKRIKDMMIERMATQV